NDAPRLEPEPLVEHLLELPLERAARRLRVEHDVPALPVREHVSIAVERLAELRHRHAPVAADVDAAQEDGLPGHQPARTASWISRVNAATLSVSSLSWRVRLVFASRSCFSSCVCRFTSFSRSRRWLMIVSRCRMSRSAVILSLSACRLCASRMSGAA